MVKYINNIYRKLNNITQYTNIETKSQNAAYLVMNKVNWRKSIYTDF